MSRISTRWKQVTSLTRYVSPSFTIFNDHDKSTHALGTYNVTTSVTSIALTPGTLTLTIVGNRFQQDSKLTFDLLDDSGAHTLATESSVQTSSPNAYCDASSLVYTGTTRYVNCYFATKPTVTGSRFRLHLLQQWRTWCTTILHPPCSKANSRDWSQVVKSIYDPKGNLIAGPSPDGSISISDPATGRSAATIGVYVKDPLSTGSWMRFTFEGTPLPYYYTSTVKFEGFFFCQQVAFSKWKTSTIGENYQQAYQREFECFFGGTGN